MRNLDIYSLSIFLNLWYLLVIKSVSTIIFSSESTCQPCHASVVKASMLPLFSSSMGASEGSIPSTPTGFIPAHTHFGVPLQLALSACIHFLSWVHDESTMNRDLLSCKVMLRLSNHVFPRELLEYQPPISAESHTSPPLRALGNHVPKSDIGCRYDADAFCSEWRFRPKSKFMLPFHSLNYITTTSSRTSLLPSDIKGLAKPSVYADLRRYLLPDYGVLLLSLDL